MSTWRTGPDSIDPKIMRLIIGHSSIVTTRGYQHASVEQAAAALEQVAGQLQLTAG